jgi:hypothetical protein
MMTWSGLRRPQIPGWLGSRRSGRGRGRKVSTVAVLTAGALVALAVPAAAHVENPGSFTFSEANAVLNLGLVPVPLPAGSMTGQIDSDGNITIPDSALQMTDQPFSFDTEVNGVAVSMSGTGTVTTGSLTGTLDPGTGAMSLSTSIFASLTFAATITLPTGETDYSETCTVGGSAPADQLPVSLSTAPPGTPYSEQTGTVTMSADLGHPIVCDRVLPFELDFLLNSQASTGLTLPGRTTPILLQDARLSPSPSGLDFGDVQVGTSKTLTETFSNSGTDPTYITDLPISGTTSFASSRVPAQRPHPACSCRRAAHARSTFSSWRSGPVNIRPLSRSRTPQAMAPSNFRSPARVSTRP